MGFSANDGGSGNATSVTAAFDLPPIPISPQLISINPNNGAIFNFDIDPAVNPGLDNVLQTSPRELTFRFASQPGLDPSTFAGIRITRSGFDGTFGNGNDVQVVPGYIGFGASSSVVIARFAAALPDDKYKIEIFGTDNALAGATALRNTDGELYVVTEDATDDGLNQDTIYFELKLGAQVVSVVPQPVSRVNEVSLGGSPSSGTFTLNFNGETTNPINFNASDTVVQAALEALSKVNPGDVTVSGSQPWNVAFQGQYGGRDLPFTINGSSLVGAGLAPKVTERGLSQARNQILVYFNEDDLHNVAIETPADPSTGPTVVNPSFYKLIQTKDTARNTDDSAPILPTKIYYDPATNKAVLTFADDIANLAGSGTYRLRIGTDEFIPNSTAPMIPVMQVVSADAGSSFNSANRVLGDLSATNNTSQIIASTIERQALPLDYPGDQDEPGHRDLEFPFDSHVSQAADQLDGITVVFYNFRNDYGVSPNGAQLFNAITAAQKQRVREIVELASQYYGVQFVETANQGITIATGDPRAINPNATLGANGVGVIANGNIQNGLVILNAAYNWYDGYGQEDSVPATLSWFQTAASGIGLILGGGFSNDLPALQFQQDIEDSPTNTSPGLIGLNVTTPEPVFPGDADIVHGQYLYRPDSRDIDMYEFTLTDSGIFTAETMAERLNNSSPLNTVLRLYREVQDASGAPVFDGNGNPVRILISQNDDYFSEDSLIRLDLEPGKYFVGVSASGNANYDPAVTNSGSGGLTEGAYELRLDFRPDADKSIVDVDGTPLDGDADGVAGGLYNFWFRTESLSRVLDVTGNGNTIVEGQTITISNGQAVTRTFEFSADAVVTGSNVRVNYVAGATPSTASAIAASLMAAINGPTGFNSASMATAAGSQVTLNGERSVVLSVNSLGIDRLGKTIFIDKTAAAGTADGSRSKPFSNISGTSGPSGFANAYPGDVVRIVGNGGVDGSLDSLNDAFAYEIGFGGPGNTVRSDGATMEVPQGVTVMIDAGALFKLREARIGVGSSTASVDRSAGALQVLGTPEQNVFFTSYDDRNTGVNTNTVITTPQQGNWGGIVFREDIDRSRGRFSYDREGIFLSYVNHADMKYGGGNVRIDGVLQIVNPIHLTETRPTISHNTITLSADAAISADPNSFEESNFHAPRAQASGAFVSDYGRVGPDIHGNVVTANSNNSLFVRIGTPAGGALKQLTVPGRFNDTDIVHTISENLVIQGTPGGSLLEEIAPSLGLLAFDKIAGGNLSAGTYEYRITYVDANGIEALPSAPSAKVTLDVGAAQGTVRLRNLPLATAGFVGRRLYRSDVLGTGTYELVAQIDAVSTTFVDTGKKPGGSLRVPALNALLLTPQPAGSLPAGTYKYKIAFVDSLGRESLLSATSDGVAVNGANASLRLDSIPKLADHTRKIYRSAADGNGPYLLVATLSDDVTTTYLDLGPTSTPTPSVAVSSLTASSGGSLASGTYNYRMTFVGLTGEEGLPSASTVSLSIGGLQGSIQVSNLQTLPGHTRRLYRSILNSPGEYTLVAELNESSTSYVDIGGSAMAAIEQTTVRRARLDASLVIDPGIIVKLEGAHIQADMGAQLIAEAHEGQEIIFTSRADDRYGASGEFDTNNDNDNLLGVDQPTPGDWGGLFFGPTSRGSIDHALITHAGGINRIEGDFAGFNAVEIHQAEVRLTNSVIENNASGVGGSAASERAGRGFNAPGAIFVRGAQPIIVGNVISNNGDVVNNVNTAAININVNSLNFRLLEDYGRSTGDVNVIRQFRDNQGPLIRDNQIGGNEINGMTVRGGILTTQGVWDDTDIVHVVFDEIIVPDFHTYGGLRLESGAAESLVVKLSGAKAGFTASGRPLDIRDRIGGSLQIVGRAGFPVVLTSLNDSSVGAGFQPNGLPQVQTNNLDSGGVPGDWRSILLDQYAADRNVAVVLESEAADEAAPGPNATPDTAQFIGSLAANEKSGDENLRLGFEVHGFISAPADIDVYSFVADGGTEVWFDIDRTTSSFDSVLELVDSSGNLIARSDNSYAEGAGAGPLVPNPQTLAFQLDKSPFISKDRWSTNELDAGLRVALPGAAGARSIYHVRVRSSNPNVDADLNGGLTFGVYQLQLRIGELDEVPGSTISFADIRYAQNGIEIIGGPTHSPLLGEIKEDASDSNDGRTNDSIGAAQFIGNVLNADRGTVSIAGAIDPDSWRPLVRFNSNGLLVTGESGQDNDFYEFDLIRDSVEHAYSNMVSTTFDLDLADGLGRADTSLWVFAEVNVPNLGRVTRLILSGRNSNIAEDQGGALQGADLDALARQSFGTLDPYIGPVYLPENVSTLRDDPSIPSFGRFNEPYTYYVVVTSNSQSPNVLDQFYKETSVNQNVKLEPINSIERIAEDHIEGNSSISINRSRSTNPIGNEQLPVLFDSSSSTSSTNTNSTSAVPFHLGDANLFVSRGVGLFSGTSSTIYMVDPFTGTQEVTIGSLPGSVGDIAMRSDGRLFSFQTAAQNGDTADGDTDDYLNVNFNNGTNARTDAGTTALETYVLDAAGTNVDRAPLGTNNDGVGFRINAIDYFGTGDNSGFLVGTRDDAASGAGFEYGENIVFNFNINNGSIPGNAKANDISRLQGGGLNEFDRGRILTLTEVIPQRVGIGDTFTLTLGNDSIRYTATGAFGAGNLELEVANGLRTAWTQAAQTNLAFAAFQVTQTTFPQLFTQGRVPGLSIRLISPLGANIAPGPSGNILAGSSSDGDGLPFESLSVDGFGPGGTITGLAIPPNSFNGTAYAVSNQGGLYQVDLFGGSSNLGDYVESSAVDLLVGDFGSPILFQGLTFGPQKLSNGAYANTLFAIDGSGDLYAMNTVGALQPIFENGALFVSTNLSNANGLDFSTLEENLWHVTGNRGTDTGHGIPATLDGRVLGHGLE